MRVRIAVILLFFAAAAFAAGPRHEVFVVYPGAPGDTKQAQETMDALAGYLGRESGLDLGAIYYNKELPARNALAEKKPAFGILALDVYLAWKAAGQKLAIVAQSERRGAATERYHVLVRKESAAKSLADLRGGVLVASYLEDARFASKVVFAGALDTAKDVAFVTTRSNAMRRAIIACATGRKLADGRAVDAVVLDDDQLAHTLEGLKESAELRTLWSSAPLPTPPVVEFVGAGADSKRLEKTLLGMASSPEGKRILEQIQATGFRKADSAAYEAAEKAY